MADRDSQKKSVCTYICYKVNRFIMPASVNDLAAAAVGVNTRYNNIRPNSAAATAETFLFGLGLLLFGKSAEYFGATCASGSGETPGHVRRGGVINHVAESIDTSASAANVENMFTVSVQRAGGAPRGEPERGRGAPLPSQTTD